jgi:phage terminase large subunit-like protein
MAGRPVKTLRAHVTEGTFRARRDTHRALLGGPPLTWRAFASLQARYLAASSEPERRDVALKFEQLVAAAQREARKRDRNGLDEPSALAAELLTLGKPGSVGQLLKFFPYYLAHPRGPMIGQPFTLEAWQQRFLREFYRLDKNGERIYSVGVLGVPRGNGKTPLAAGLGLYELVTRTDNPEVYCAAASKEQAGIAFGFARDFVEEGPLADWVRASKFKLQAERGLMQVISSEGRLQHGRAPSAALLDELWAFETKREQQTYIALRSALNKRVNAYLLAITTAGYDKHSLLGEIYQAALNWPEVTVSKNGCLTVAKDLEHGMLLYWYGAPGDAAIDDEKIWRACNPASWIRLRDLKRERADPGLGELEFRRLHLNMWTAVRDAWLDDGCWAGLRTDQQIPDGADIYLGVDIGLYHDTTAVCWAHRLEDGRTLLDAHVWSADPKLPAHTHVRGGKIRLEQIEAFILDLKRRYRVREVAYDPRFFDRSAELLEQAGLTMVEFLQNSGPMADAYQSFYQLAHEGLLCHNGDPIFAAHVEATAAEKTERGWKVRKLKSSQRIDATVAAVLAVARAQHHPDQGPPQIFWLDDS